jgi:hypothetical protein
VDKLEEQKEAKLHTTDCVWSAQDNILHESSWVLREKIELSDRTIKDGIRGVTGIAIFDALRLLKEDLWANHPNSRE